ncbi:MAG: outer membrane protein transport protein [Pseudomonadota bacterium]
MKKGGAIAAALASVVAITAANNSHAGSFALKERSAKSQGVSFAGASAGSGGIQSMGFNPAVVTMVEEGTVLSGGLSLIQPIADGVATINGQSVDAAEFAGVTNGYIAHRLDPDLWVGLSVFTPFGLATAYEPDFVGAADGLTSQLQTIQFSPTLGIQPFNGVSFAISANILYANARLTSAIVNLDGNQIAAGFTVGALFEPTSTTTLGIAYDHGYDLSLPGTATFRPAAAAIPSLAPLAGATVPAVADASLPATVSAGIVQDIGSSFRVMGELQYQFWSAFDSIDTTITTPFGDALLSDEQNYDDAFFAAIGAEVDVLDELAVRAGAAWDQTPTIDGIEGRTVRVPDEDRIWLSIGATYEMNDHMDFDLGYSYLFTIDDPVVTLRNGPAAGSTVVYDGGAHIFSVGGSLKF